MHYNKQVFDYPKNSNFSLTVTDTVKGKIISAVDSKAKPIYADPLEVISFLETKDISCEPGTWFYLVFPLSPTKYRPVLVRLWDIPFIYEPK